MTKKEARERPHSFPSASLWRSYVFGPRLPLAMPADPHLLPLLLILLLLPSVLVISSGDAGGVVRAEGGQPVPTGPPPGDNVTGDASLLTADPPFALRVLVRDQVTRQPVGGASVAVYASHALSSSARSGERGEVLLRAPYRPGGGLTLLASMHGYVPTQLLWRTSKRPIFSSVTLLLLPQSQGNIWLFQDSLLITGKLADLSSQPSVQFPRSLLALPDNGNISSLVAFLTVPRRHVAKDCANCTVGTVRNKSGNRTVELKAVAAVSASLVSAGREVPVRGPVQISLPLAEPSSLRPSDTVPAWAFNLNTGAWETRGAGTVKRVNSHLVWTYTASHLGYWVAAPLPSSNDYSGHASTIDLISYHSYLLLGILGGTLAIVVGFLSVLLCRCGSSRPAPRRRTARFSKLSVAKKDQTTSTHADESFRPGEWLHGAGGGAQCDPSSSSAAAAPRHKANYNIYVEDPGGRGGGGGATAAAPLYENVGPERTKGRQSSPRYASGDEAARPRDGSDQNRARAGVAGQDKLVHVYNRATVAVIQEPPPPPGCKETQAGGGAQGSETPPPGPGGAADGGGAWGRYSSSLLESSVSAPGTLNEAGGAFGGGRGGGELQGVSERTLLELTRGGGGGGRSAHHHHHHPPRAWFVSLDGKPAARVRHSVIDLPGPRPRRRPAPPSSNDTSLDSGVDMNETSLRGGGGGGGGVREEEGGGRPSVRAFSFPRRGGRGTAAADDPDLSSSESGTTATCTPEDPAPHRNVLDGSSAAIPNIPEERDGVDTSSAQEDDSESRGATPPPPRRLRKAREKGRAEKRSARHVREERHLAKRS